MPKMMKLTEILKTILKDTGGSGVVDTYSCLIPPPPVVNFFIILETDFYVLQEDGFKIYIQ